MNHKGISLVELLVGLALLSLLSVIVIMAVRGVSASSFRFWSRSQTDEQIFTLAKHLSKIGRHAGTATGGVGCSVNSTPPAPDLLILTCAVDFTIPPTGNATNVRFRFTAGETVVYETETAPGVYTPGISYTRILDLRVCDQASMQNGSCPLLPVELSADHLTHLAGPNRPNRYFRFRIVGRSQDNSQDTLNSQIAVQSAFYVRNPTPIGMVYQWGSVGESTP